MTHFLFRVEIIVLHPPFSPEKKPVMKAVVITMRTEYKRVCLGDGEVKKSLV